MWLRATLAVSLLFHPHVEKEEVILYLVLTLSNTLFSRRVILQYPHSFVGMVSTQLLPLNVLQVVSYMMLVLFNYIYIY